MSISPRSLVFLLLISLDYIASALIFGRTGITVSSQAFMAHQSGGPRVLRGLYRALEWAQPGHCLSAVESDIYRAQTAIRILNATLPRNEETR